MTRHSACQCEHVDHFHSPHSANEVHAYGAELEVTPVKTDYGTFHMCKDCEEHHQLEAGVPYYPDAMMEDNDPEVDL